MPAGSGTRYHVSEPFGVLGLKPGCSAAEARAAYVKLAKQHHPDVSSAANAGEEFRRITDAYDSVATHIKARSSGHAGAGGHAGYDAERMAARVREFRQRASEMRAAHDHGAKARAADQFWLRMQHRAGENRFLLVLPLLLAVGWVFVSGTEREMGRRRSEAETISVSPRPAGAAGVSPETAAARARRVEKDRRAAMRKHLLALAAEKRLYVESGAAASARPAPEARRLPPSPARDSSAEGALGAPVPGPLDEMVVARRGGGGEESAPRRRRVLAGSAVPRDDRV